MSNRVVALIEIVHEFDVRFKQFTSESSKVDESVSMDCSDFSVRNKHHVNTTNKQE